MTNNYFKTSLVNLQSHSVKNLGIDAQRTPNLVTPNCSIPKVILKESPAKKIFIPKKMPAKYNESSKNSITESKKRIQKTLQLMTNFKVPHPNIAEIAKSKIAASSTRGLEKLNLDRKNTFKIDPHSRDLSHAFDYYENSNYLKTHDPYSHSFILNNNASLIHASSSIEKDPSRGQNTNRMFEKHLENIYKNPGMLGNSNAIEEEKKKLSKSKMFM